MNRFIILATFCLVALSTLSAQIAFNTTLRDQLQYNQSLNDVWGYVDPNGVEYALVGARNGLSIVSLADPDNIEEVQFIDGDPSTWRDMKTFGHYAYVTTDEGDDGLLIVDMSGTPGEFEFQYLNLPDANGETLLTAHNLYIDNEKGVMYIAGGNYNAGGMVIYELNTDPYNPTLVSNAPSIYAHDVYVLDNTMYSSDIFLGRLTIYDVSDLQNITELGNRVTPFSFCHNAWTTPDRQYVFTTDERADASTAAYDISDPSDPILLDEFRPNRSVGEGVIPHNTHVLNDYLITSHYTDGLEIVDASVPSNMVEVGFYDTWTGASGDFNGCWGAYPFLPSGLVLATDISNGLFVIEVDYQRAARVNGKVTDAVTNGNLNNVSVSITSTEAPTAATNASGDYQAGQVEAGTFEVTFSLSGYISQTQNVTLVQGEVAELDVALVPLQAFAVTGNVISAVDNSPIEGASLLISGNNGTYTPISDANGNIEAQIVIGDYQVYAGRWGYVNAVSELTVSESGSFTIELEPGYQDGFMLDQGWAEQFFAGSGQWTRGIPVGTFDGSTPVAPGVDSDNPGDLGNQAFVSGNEGGGVGNDDIDDGTIRLISPPIDLSILDEANDYVFHYDYWFFNGGGQGTAPDDEIKILLSDGDEEIEVKSYSLNNPATVSSAWTQDSFRLSEVGIDPEEPIRFIVYAEDLGAGHLVEAGLDNFSITADPLSSSEEVAANSLNVDVFPNPTTQFFTVNYQLPSIGNEAVLKVIDLQGRLLQHYKLATGLDRGNLSIGQNLPVGSYSLVLEVDGEQVSTTKIVKQ